MKKILLIVLAFCLCAMPALGETLYFNLTGPAVSGFTGNNNWSLDSSPSVSGSANGAYFNINNVSTDLGNDNIFFYNTNDGGLIADSFGVNIFGAQVYSGAESSPTFILGSYTGKQNDVGPADYTLTISDTPEPGSLFLLGSGLIGLGGTLRRKFIA